LETVEEGEGVEFNNKFELDDEESWVIAIFRKWGRGVMGDSFETLTEGTLGNMEKIKKMLKNKKVYKIEVDLLILLFKSIF